MKPVGKPAPKPASKQPDKAWAEKAELELASALSGRKVTEIPFLKPGEGRK